MTQAGKQKTWGARFDGAEAELMERFNASIGVDQQYGLVVGPNSPACSTARVIVHLHTKRLMPKITTRV